LFLTSNNFDLIDFRIDNNGAFVFFGRLIGDSVKIFNTTLTGINKYVLFKMNANLTFVWAKTINSNVIYYGYGHSLAIDNMNNIFVLADSNLIKFDSNGIQQFNIITYGQYGFGLAIDNQQNVYTFSGTNIGSSNYNANTGAVNKYTNTGTFLWAYSITDVFNGFDLIFDNLDNVILGFTSYSIQKILKINSSGSLVWSKGSTCNGTTIPCPNGSKFWLVALQNGDVYAMTDANTSINMGGITSTVIRLAASDGAPTQISYSNLGNECASYKPILNKNTNQIYSFGLRSNSNNSNDRSLLLNRFDASISTFGVTDKFSGYAYIDFDSSSTAFIILNNYNLSNLSPTLSQGYIFTIPGSSRIQIYKLRP
jgi:hypothetical protein